MAGEFTKENWEKAWLVLSGQRGNRISKRAAAEAAGTSPQTLAAWINRSKERRPEDEPWVWEIAKQMDTLYSERGETLEDVAWDAAINGKRKDIVFQGKVAGESREQDLKHTMRMLEQYKPEYRQLENTTAEVRILLDNPEEIFKRLQAQAKLHRAEVGQVDLLPIDAEFEELDAKG